MKTLKIILISLFVLIVILVVARNFIVKNSIEFMLRSKTDLTMDIEKLDIGLFSTTVDIQGLKIYNPEGFQDRIMVDLPRFFIDYDLASIIRGKIHLPAVIFYLKEFALIKKEDGATNIDSLKKLAGKEEKAPSKEEPVQVEQKELNFQIDSLDLKIDKVLIKDYTNKKKPVVNTYNVNLDEHYTDISNVRQFVTALLLDNMNQFVMNAIKNVGLEDIGGVLGDSVEAIGKFGKDAIKAVTDMGEESIGTAGKILKGTKEGLENIIKLPFGR